MEFVLIDRWMDLLEVDPAALEAGALRELAGTRIRTLCNLLNKRTDRRGVTMDLERLAKLGRLLQQHAWLGAE